MIGEIMNALGMFSIVTVMLLMAELSKKLGRVTRAFPAYKGFYGAAFLVMIGVIARIANVTLTANQLSELHKNFLWVLLYHAVPAFGVTLGVVIAWRYWSWLLAERG